MDLRITIVTTTGVIIPEIPCSSYDEINNDIVLLNETDDCVAKFNNIQGFVVKKEKLIKK